MGEFASEAFQQLKEYLKRRMPNETRELMTQGFSGITLPAFYGGGVSLDRICCLWAGIAIPYMSPSAGRMTDSGREMLTAVIAAAPSGLAIACAFEHQLDVWRTTKEGIATIETFNNMSDSEIELLDIRNVLSGNSRSGAPVTPEEDIL